MTIRTFYYINQGFTAGRHWLPKREGAHEVGRTARL